ncbi:hypothetical protein NM208_g14187 [Fusarium decemcellulare]|uniref:Uncharacterized protein n=1 Tax=Fusarium decemcellulare TaxID=57161 RepID=A0ACC1RKI6_9HYPO|nr:hypothetical protein NM208_g14187 [Fusarium decemcellulare]
MPAQNTQQEHEEHEELEQFYLFLLRATPKNGGQERQYEGLDEGLEYLEFEQLERQPSTSVEASSSGSEHDDLTELDENEEEEEGEADILEISQEEHSLRFVAVSPRPALSVFTHENRCTSCHQRTTVSLDLVLAFRRQWDVRWYSHEQCYYCTYAMLQLLATQHERTPEQTVDIAANFLETRQQSRLEVVPVEDPSGSSPGRLRPFRRLLG